MCVCFLEACFMKGKRLHAIVTLPSSFVGFAKCDAFSNFCISRKLLLNPILLVSIIGLADGMDGPGAEEKMSLL